MLHNIDQLLLKPRQSWRYIIPTQYFSNVTYRPSTDIPELDLYKYDFILSTYRHVTALCQLVPTNYHTVPTSYQSLANKYQPHRPCTCLWQSSTVVIPSLWPYQRPILTYHRAVLIHYLCVPTINKFELKHGRIFPALPSTTNMSLVLLTLYFLKL